MEKESDEQALLGEMPDKWDITGDGQAGVELILPKYQIPYSELCPFEETDEIPLFNKSNQEVLISDDLMVIRCAFCTASLTKVHDRTLYEKNFSM